MYSTAPSLFTLSTAPGVCVCECIGQSRHNLERNARATSSHRIDCQNTRADGRLPYYVYIFANHPYSGMKSLRVMDVPDAPKRGAKLSEPNVQAANATACCAVSKTITNSS